MNSFTASMSSRRFSSFFSFTNFQTLLLILVGLLAILSLTEIVRFLPVMSDNVYPEASGVLAAQRWAQGLPLYGDYRQPPYLVTAFPPLWYAVMAGASKLGLSNLDSLTLFGRAVSVCFIIGIAGLTYVWGRRLGFSIQLALLPPAFFLSFPVLARFAPAARPDFIVLFFGLLALSLAGLRSTTAFACISSFVAAFGFLILHNAVAVPVAIVLWMVWSRRWKHAFVFCAVWGIVVGGTLLTFQISSHGLMLLNLSGAKFGRLALTYSRDTLLRLLVVDPAHGIVITLFAFGILGFVEAWRRGEERARLLSIYFLVCMGRALFSSSAAGADVNHYVEPALAMAILAPIGLKRLEETWKADSAFASFTMVIILLLLMPTLDMQRWNLTHDKPDDLRALVPLVGTKRVFTDIPYLGARTSTPQALDLASLVYAERTGLWSSKAISEALRQRQYDFVILGGALDLTSDPSAPYPRYRHLDSDLTTAIGRNYRLCSGSEGRYVYTPVVVDPSSSGSNCAMLETVYPSETRSKDLSRADQSIPVP